MNHRQSYEEEAMLTLPDVLEPKGNLYIVTDSHLDEQQAPYDVFIEHLLQLETPEVLVCLGDLFRIWLAPKQFWSDANQRVLEAFRKLQQQGTRTIFVVGNREMLVPKQGTLEAKELPFSEIVHDSARLQWGEFSYGFTHGDTINPHDHQYLRWRKLVRSKPVHQLFRWMPSMMARRIASSLEAQLNHTNQEFKISFPEEEVKAFAHRLPSSIDHFFVGHFHCEQVIRAKTSTLQIVPDWLATRQILQVAPDGTQSYLTYR